MSLMQDFVCPCGHKLIYYSPRDQMLRYSTKVIKSLPTGDGVIGVCRSCGKEHPLPIAIDLQKSVSETKVAPKVSPKRIFRVMSDDGE